MLHVRSFNDKLLLSKIEPIKSSLNFNGAEFSKLLKWVDKLEKTVKALELENQALKCQLNSVNTKVKENTFCFHSCFKKLLKESIISKYGLFLYNWLWTQPLIIFCLFVCLFVCSFNFMCVCICISLSKAYVNIFLHMANHLSRLASLFLSGCAPHLANCQNVIYLFFSWGTNKDWSLLFVVVVVVVVVKLWQINRLYWVICTVTSVSSIRKQ